MTNTEKLKKHFKKYKIPYAVGGTAIGVAGITYVIMKGSHAALRGGAGCLVREPMDSFSSISSLSIFGSSNNSVVTTIHKAVKGHPGFITRCVETGELFATQGAAASAFDIPESVLSGHLNKGLALIEGLHFERLGVFE